MSKRLTIVGLGEALWDVFPDGPRLGGAPLNFACSASELSAGSADVFLASAIGDDELGRKAFESIEKHGVNTTCVQSNVQETGQVMVELDADGVASYCFVDNAAWDFLSWNETLASLAARCDAVCFGTLGQRNKQSRQVIQQFVASVSPAALKILDVNLRQPFVSDAVILESLELATVLKLNEEELPQLASLCKLSGSTTEVLHGLAYNFRLAAIALTRGADGATLIRGDQASHLPGMQVVVADTVGAGDAFTAAMTLGMLAGRELEKVNELAMATAAYVCSNSGATMHFPQHLVQALQPRDR